MLAATHADLPSTKAVARAVEADNTRRIAGDPAQPTDITHHDMLDCVRTDGAERSDNALRAAQSTTSTRCMHVNNRGHRLRQAGPCSRPRFRGGRGVTFACRAGREVLSREKTALAGPHQMCAAEQSRGASAFVTSDQHTPVDYRPPNPGPRAGLPAIALERSRPSGRQPSPGSPHAGQPPTTADPPGRRTSISTAR